MLKMEESTEIVLKTRDNKELFIFAYGINNKNQMIWREKAAPYDKQKWHKTLIKNNAWEEMYIKYQGLNYYFNVKCVSNPQWFLPLI
jgi:hypothetical protein